MDGGKKRKYVPILKRCIKASCITEKSDSPKKNEISCHTRSIGIIDRSVELSVYQTIELTYDMISLCSA